MDKAKSKPELSVVQENPEPAASGDDSLLGCLVFLCRHFQRPYSPEALTAGMPEGPMGIDHFARASARAGLWARVEECCLEQIADQDLPAVLLFHDAGAGILTGRAKDGRTAQVWEKNNDEPMPVSLEDLKKRYSGYCIRVFDQHRAGDVETEKGVGQHHWLASALARDRWIYAQVALAGIFIGLFALTSSIFIMTVYDRVVPNNAVETLWALALGAAIVYLFDFALRSLRGYFIDTAGRRADVLLAHRLFDRLLDVQYHQRPASAGEFANLLRELETLRDFFTSATLTTVVDLPFVLLFLVVIWIIGGPLVLVLMGAVLVLVLAGMIIRLPLKRWVGAAFKENQHKHAVLIEALNGLETIKALGGEGRMRRRWLESVRIGAVQGQRSRFLSLLAINVTLLVQQMASVGIVVVGVYLIRSGDLSQGALVACVILGGRTLAPLAQIAQLLTRLQHALQAFRALDRVMGLPVERPRGKRFLHRNALTGRIRFDRVSFAYGAQSPEVLQAVSFTIEAGERVALIGRTGSGKSTIHKMILNLYPPAAGGVLIDDTDIRQIDPADLRRALGCVPQEVHLFSGTLKENITMGRPDATDAQILEAARAAGVHDFAGQHPMGYDLPIGERGEGLSGGQRQAVALARALVAPGPVLLLDEPSSAIDNRSEALLRQRLAAHLDHGRTLVLITHRSSMLALVDRIIVMDAGRVVADGQKGKVLADLAAGRVPMAA